MPDETTDDPQQESPPAPTQIETVQAERARGAQLAVKEQYVRHCLAVLAPVADDGARSYVALLQRLQTVITHELEEQHAHA